ncbi:MAG: tetratricopeptide repeat protein [Melioribacteraceae bacterium]|nr:tetratricopeptide repeat protein [Melioribacteraceae bacterium]
MKKIINILFLIIFAVSILGCNNSDTYSYKVNVEAKKYYDKAKKEYKKSQFKRAIITLTKAIRLDPKNAKLYTKRGDCYRKIRKAQKAIKDYDIAIKYNKSSARAYYHRGTLKIILGKKDDGCLDVKKSKSLAYIPANNYYKEHCE